MQPHASVLARRVVDLEVACAAAPSQPPYLRVLMERGAPLQDGVTSLAFAATGADVGWARWRWDGRAATVETCRYGVRPLFYHATARCFMISPSIPKLLA